jgi:flagellar biosynthetic protein FliR
VEDLLQISPTILETLWGVFFVFLRVGALVFVAPGFGESYVPTRIKLAISVSFTLIVFPAVEGVASPVPSGFWGVAKLAMPEVLSGLLFGLGLRFFVFSLQIAGSIAGQSTSLAQLFGGANGADAQAAIGHVLVAAGLAMAALMGLHVLFARYILQSYQMVPIGILIPSQTMVSLGVSEVARAFSLGFQLSAPFLIASLIYNVTLGVINRAMPQLMVSFVGAPAITAGAILLLSLGGPLLISIWYQAFYVFVEMPFGKSR